MRREFQLQVYNVPLADNVSAPLPQRRLSSNAEPIPPQTNYQPPLRTFFSTPMRVHNGTTSFSFRMKSVRRASLSVPESQLLFVVSRKRRGGEERCRSSSMINITGCGKFKSRLTFDLPVDQSIKSRFSAKLFRLSFPVDEIEPKVHSTL